MKWEDPKISVSYDDQLQIFNKSFSLSLLKAAAFVC